jgi:anaerobic selenocysteine-containing dehydrogenase
MPTHFRTCNLCEAICGVAIETEGSRVVSIRGDKDDPFSRGHICPKAAALEDVQNDPDRLRLPLRRTASGWETMGWDAAFDEVASRLAGVQAAHGRSAVAVYQGNPTVHSYTALLYGQIFVKSLRTRARFSATSVDQLPHMLASLLMFGHQALFPVPDLDRTDHLLILGANPVVSNGSLMTAPDVANRLKAIRARGGSVVVVDPRRTETAEIADAHHFIRPGADALLLLALLRTVFEAGRVTLGACEDFASGIEAVREAVRPYSPERVAGRVGIAAPAIRAMALAFASAKSAVCYGRVGVSMQRFGSLCAWLVNVLNAVTGNLDRAGGAMFSSPAVDIVGLAGRSQTGHFGLWKSRVRGLPEFGGELPVATLAEEIETPGEGQIRALVTMAGNPVLSTPNGRRLDAALAGLDFMVSIDLYLNETTRHANIILPPTFTLEHDHYDLALHLLAVRNTVKYSLPLFQPAPDARHDWEIMSELAVRMGGGKGVLGRLGARALAGGAQRLGPRRLLDLALRIGPHGDRFNPFSDGLSLRKLTEAPHGIDLGPLVPRLPGRLFTRDHRIDLAPRAFLDDLPRLAATLEEGANGSVLELVGRRELRSNNSWMHNSRRLVKGPERCTVLMHPADAAARGLADGQKVRVASRVGEVTAPLEVSDEVMPGVVSLPHGWGHDRAGSRLSVAGARPGVSINDLTDEALLDVLSGNASFSGTPVTIAAAQVG